LNDAIETKIKESATSKSFPDEDDYRSVSVETVAELAAQLGVPGSQVEISALSLGIIPERYARNMKSFSLDDQIKLLKSKVSIVGLGGLGGGVTEILARVGVGNLTLIDGDSFEDHNLNRQFLSRHEFINTPKAEAAIMRVKEINSSVSVRHHASFLSEKNGEDLLGHPDVIVDCLDSLHTRMVLERFSKRIGVPLVSAAVAGGAGHVTTIFPEDDGLRLIYGDSVDQSRKGAEATLGCLPQAVTLLSSLESSEVINILIDPKRTLRNKLLVVDLSDNTFDTLRLSQ
jgi:molybdopterin/thiamine biosynthesis adenylyltransferase